MSRLLVVDDDDLNRDMLARRLSRREHEVVTASSGREALDLVAAGGIELVLLDVMMPGISGLEVLRVIRETLDQSQLPVLMVTAKDQSQDVVAALELGANDYVSKPIDLPVLLARLRAQLDRKAAADAHRSLLSLIDRRLVPGLNDALQAANLLECQLGATADAPTKELLKALRDTASVVIEAVEQAGPKPQQKPAAASAGLAGGKAAPRGQAIGVRQ